MSPWTTRMKRKATLGLLSSSLLLLCLVDSGCVTKRYVRESIAPVQNQANQTQSQVGSLREQADQSRERIGDIERRLAITDEKSASARAKSEDAFRLSGRALETAIRAGQRADAAGRIAQQAGHDVSQLAQRFEEASNPLESYHLAVSEKIYFEYSESGLDKGEAAKLDRVLSKVSGMKSYMVEVEGFADSSGSVSANRTLSRKRAASVIHYLVVEHGLPLRTVSDLGAGSDFPRADNQTPNARRENRRVEVRIYLFDNDSRLAAAGDAQH